MSWGKKIIGGAEYDLTHLDPFTMRVTPKGVGTPTFNVLVTFSCHTFTTDCVPGDTEEEKIPDENGERTFCPIRYGHSLILPAAMRAAAAGKVYFSNKTRFLITAVLPGCAGPYAIYFNAIKANSKGLDAVVDVRSAHHKPGLATNLPRITFATVIGNTVAGRPIIQPKK